MHMKRYVQRIGFLVYSMILVMSLLSTSANAATYYLSPVGSDAQSGISSSTPWKTFSFAISKLQPGDTLRLLNGHYTFSANTRLTANCAAGRGRNGTGDVPSQRITIMADNERQAWLDGDGSTPTVDIRNCAYWTLQGLHVSSKDNPAGVDGAVFFVKDSSYMIVRRNLVHQNNRYKNEQGLVVSNTNNLIEENEVYSFHRHGISAKNNSVVRRNYINSRNRADLPNCSVTPVQGQPKCSDPSTMGDDGIVCYPCEGTIYENNIVENVGTGIMFIAEYGPQRNNRLYGNIALNTNFGVRQRARAPGLDGMPRDIWVKDQVVIGSKAVGIHFMGTKNARCDNCTILDALGSGMQWEVEGNLNGDGAQTGYSTNVLIVGSDGQGLRVQEYEQWSMNELMLYNNAGGYSPALTDSHYSNVSQANPNLGTCRVYIPQGSPAKGAGVGGADIGANVLYRYVNGVLTTTPLWDSMTSRFPCGAQVAGVNDIAGSSCFDVHKRLNVNTNGCMLPTLGSPPPTSAFPKPTNLRISGSQP